jgi:hypothetical protein
LRTRTRLKLLWDRVGEVVAEEKRSLS